MTLLACAVYDRKAELFHPPFFMRTRGEALRSFQDVANRDDTMIGRHPGDFELVMLATFDEKSGAFGDMMMENLGRASEYRRVQGVVSAVADNGKLAVAAGGSHGKVS